MEKESQHIELKESWRDESLITVSNASWDEIDEKTVRLFVSKALMSNRLSSSTRDIRDLFAQLGLSRNGLLTRAAVLLFLRQHAQYFPSAVCRIERFCGNEHADLKMYDLIECPVFLMPDRIMETLASKYIQTNLTDNVLRHTKVWEYPEMALREAITNAIVHRDYDADTVFTIKVFDNRMELWNEGRLMSPLSIELLKTEHLSRVRNKLIANVFYCSGKVELWGLGTLRMLHNAAIGEYPEPEFKNFENGILVILYKKVVENEK